MKKIKVNIIDRQTEGMLKSKTNQDYNGKKPDADDPNEKNQNQNLDGHESRETAEGEEGEMDENLKN